MPPRWHGQTSLSTPLHGHLAQWYHPTSNRPGTSGGSSEISRDQGSSAAMAVCANETEKMRCAIITDPEPKITQQSSVQWHIPSFSQERNMANRAEFMPAVKFAILWSSTLIELCLLRRTQIFVSRHMLNSHSAEEASLPPALHENTANAAHDGWRLSQIKTS